MKLSLNSACP